MCLHIIRLLIAISWQNLREPEVSLVVRSLLSLDGVFDERKCSKVTGFPPGLLRTFYLPHVFLSWVGPKTWSNVIKCVLKITSEPLYSNLFWQGITTSVEQRPGRSARNIPMEHYKVDGTRLRTTEETHLNLHMTMLANCTKP